MKQLYYDILEKTHNKCIGLGGTYINHSKTMEEQLKAPLLFQKPLSSLILNPKTIEVKTETGMLHEVEVGVIISKKGTDIKAEEAMDYIGGYYLLLDLTSSSLFDYRKEGKSFCIAKMGDNYLPVSDFITPEEIGELNSLEIELQINGKVRQKDLLKNLLFSIPKQLEFISKFTTLNPGDLILTGTPDGISAFNSGDVLEAFLRREDKVISTLKVDVHFKKI